MKQRAILLSNGQLQDPALIRTRLKEWAEAMVVGVDGGSLHCESLGLSLHAIVGDLDSITDERKASLIGQDVTMRTSPREKDETDLELALLYAADQGAEEIVVIGAFGGRIDMSIGNLLLLTHPDLAGMDIQLWNGSQTAWIIRPPGDEVRGEAGDTLSLIPLIGDVTGVTTENLAYPLRDEQLPAGFSRGLSNVLTKTTASIKLQEGFLLAVHTPGRA